MRTWIVMLLSATLAGCSPLTGTWTGTCDANGEWALELRLSPSGDSLEGAERPGEWSSVHGSVEITPSLDHIQSAEVTLYHCPEAQAPCTYMSGNTATEAEAGFVQGEVIDPTQSETVVAMRFFGFLVDDNEEIEGSCYNLVEGGSGSLRLDH